MNRTLTSEMWWIWEELAVTCCKLLASNLPGVAVTNRIYPLTVFSSEPRSVESVPVFRDPEHGAPLPYTFHSSLNIIILLLATALFSRPDASEVLLPC
jgi:hypothetical protein